LALVLLAIPSTSPQHHQLLKIEFSRFIHKLSEKYCIQLDGEQSRVSVDTILQSVIETLGTSIHQLACWADGHLGAGNCTSILSILNRLVSVASVWVEDVKCRIRDHIQDNPEYDLFGWHRPFVLLDLAT
jgi:hypothetical protein